jgi:hypothetical protein
MDTGWQILTIASYTVLMWMVIIRRWQTICSYCYTHYPETRSYTLYQKLDSIFMADSAIKGLLFIWIIPACITGGNLIAKLSMVP